jgi:hypothetical protein
MKLKRRPLKKESRFRMIFLIVSLIIIISPIIIYFPANTQTHETIIDKATINLPGSSMQTTDYIIINNKEHPMDKEEIESIQIEKSSSLDEGITKISYLFRNKGQPREIRFAWKQILSEKYDKANERPLSESFETNEPELTLYSKGIPKYFLTFKDIVSSFDGVAISYNPETRLLTATSNPVILMDELLLDPGGGEYPEITINSPANNSVVSASTLLNITVTDDQAPIYKTYIFGSNLQYPNQEDLLYYKINATNSSPQTFSWNFSPLDVENKTLVLYHFDNRSEYGENNSFVNDFAGNHDGNISGNPILNTTSNAVLAGHLDFDGTGDFITVGDCDFDCYGIKNLTYLAWVRPEFITGARTIFSSYYSAAGGFGFNVFSPGSGNITIYEDGLVKVIEEENFFTLNEWLHLGIVILGNGTITVYRNGSEFTSADLTSVTNVSAIENFYIGAFASNGNSPWNGSMDEVSIINRSLSSEEILNTYRNKNDTYFWRVVADEGTLITNSSVSRLFWGINPSIPSLNSPATNVRFTSTGNIILNLTVTDEDGTIPFTRLWGGNSGSDRLLSQEINKNNNTFLTHNFTSLPLKPDSDYLLLVHLDNRSDYAESSSLVYDYSGNGRNGTVQGNRINMTAGRFAGAYKGTGQNGQAIDFGDDDDLIGTQNITYIAWLKTDDISSAPKIIFSKHETAIPSMGLQLYRESSNITIQIDDETFKVADYFTNELYKYVFFTFVVFEDGRIFIYKNGNFWENVTYTTITDNANILTLGADYSLGTYTSTWNGSIDEFAVINKSLNSTEVLELYQLKDGAYYWQADAGDIDLSNPTATEIRNFIIDSSPTSISDAVIISDDPYNGTSGNLAGGYTLTTSGSDEQVIINETKWYKNGVEITSLINNTQITFGNTSRGEGWIFSVKVFDGYNWTPWINSSVFTIQNTPPLISDIKIYNATGYETSSFQTGDTIIIRTNITDADGEVDLKTPLINISSPDQALQLNSAPMTVEYSITNGFAFRYIYTISQSLSGLWRIDVYSEDSVNISNKSGYFTVGITTPPSPTIQITLTLNNTQNTVYIPGQGEKTIPEAVGTYSNPTNYYLASYRTNNMKALVFSQQTPISLQVSYNSTHHFLTLNQNITNSQALLTFTRGSYREIDNRISLVEEGSFFSKISPSFSFAFGETNPLKLALNYTNLDIRGNFTLTRGNYRAIIEDIGALNNKEVIRIEII